MVRVGERGTQGAGPFFLGCDLVLVTRGHPDYMEALQFFSGKSILIAFPELEMDFFRAEGQEMSPRGLSYPQPEILLRDLWRWVIKGWRSIPPPDTLGSICLYWPETRALFSGDVWFKQTVGRTDLPGGSSRQLQESLRKLIKLEVEYLLPGVYHRMGCRGEEF